jgi:hypothetical protein
MLFSLHTLGGTMIVHGVRLVSVKKKVSLGKTYGFIEAYIPTKDGCMEKVQRWGELPDDFDFRDIRTILFAGGSYTGISNNLISL